MMVFLYLSTNIFFMLTKSDKSQLRGIIFRHLDGIATATSAFSLHKKQILEYILEKVVRIK